MNGTVEGRTLVGLIAELQRDQALGEAWRDRFVGPVRDQHRMLVARGVERGELAPGTDPEVLLDLVFARIPPTLAVALPLDDQFAQTVIDTIIPGADA